MAAPLLVANLVVGDTVELARAALDGALDAVLRHVGFARFIHGKAQPRIGIGIGAAELCRYRDLLDQAREDLALLRIRRRLAVLDVRPFAVTRHSMILASWQRRSS